MGTRQQVVGRIIKSLAVYANYSMISVPCIYRKNEFHRVIRFYFFSGFRSKAVNLPDFDFV
jgi:hypothetical protein